MDNVSLMRRAKQMLAGNWVNAAIGALIYLAIMSIAGYTYILTLLVAGPIIYGFYLFISCIVDTKRADFNLIFKGFERYVDTMLAGLIYILLTTLGIILLIVPGIIVQCGLSMTFFIMNENPNISGVDAVKESWNLMNGHKWDYFCLNLRFIGWALLCILTLGIGLLWLYPYMTAAQLNFYRRIRYGVY